MVEQALYHFFGTRIPHHRDFGTGEMAVPLHQNYKQQQT